MISFSYPGPVKWRVRMELQGIRLQAHIQVSLATKSFPTMLPKRDVPKKKELKSLPLFEKMGVLLLRKRFFNSNDIHVYIYVRVPILALYTYSFRPNFAPPIRFEENSTTAPTSYSYIGIL